MRSLLVTGGTGSFGRAIVTHLLNQDDPQRIVVFSRGEHAQAEMARALSDPHQRLHFFIGDVRDRDRLRRALQGCDTVIHAAALKRIEVGRYNPIEMVKTNIHGAINVIEAATDAGVKKVVALSTDKAWRPVSPYGQSKALAETLFLNANNTRGETGPIFAVTRYGNVAGSNGSVIPLWRSLSGNGARVSVTDPECTRFWMTMDEAIALVLKTVQTMQGGELAIPQLPAFRLGDLAQAMGLAYDINGLPPWEKKHEGLSETQTSDAAPRLSIPDLKERLAHV